MTLSISTQASPVASKLIVDTDATATVQSDVTGTSGVIYNIDIDNSGNSDNAAYVKIYDNADPTVGTTHPDLVLKVAISSRRSFVIPEGIAFTNLSYCCVTNGGTAGTTSPTSDVTVRIVSS